MTGNWLVADEVVFEKQLPDGQKIIVSRKRVPYVPPTKEEIEEFLKDFPGAELKPDYKHLVHEYTLALISSDSNQQKMLWLKQYTDSGAEPRISAEFKFFDAIFELDTLLITYKDTGETIADIIKVGQKKAEESMVRTGTVLSEDGPFEKVISAKIEGSFKADSIAVNFQFLDGKSSKWVLKKNVWTEVPGSLPEAPKPPANRP